MRQQKQERTSVQAIDYIILKCRRENSTHDELRTDVIRWLSGLTGEQSVEPSQEQAIGALSSPASHDR